MSKGTIGRISLCVEVDGKAYAVALPQDRMMLLVKLAESLSDNGKLPVSALGENFYFEEQNKATP